MKNAEENRWLDNILGEAIGSEKSKPDFEKWEENHRGEVEMLTSRSRGGSAAGARSFSKGLRIMKNPITTIAAAAVIVIVVLIGIEMFSGSGERPSGVITEKQQVREKAIVSEKTPTDELGLNTKRELKLTENVDVELKKIEQMYAAGDIDGLIAMLAAGQTESKIAASNFLARMNEAQAGGPPESIKTAYAKDIKEERFVAAEKNRDNIREGKDKGTVEAEVLAGLTRTGEVSPAHTRPEPDATKELETVSEEDELVEVDSVTAGKHTVAVDFEGYVVYPADVDGDGDLDVVGSARDEGYSSARGGVNTTALSMRKLSDLGAVEYDVEPSDKTARGALYWWENTDGDGTAWAEHIVDVNFGAVHVVFPSDIDGDGDVDIIGSDTQAGALVWWENTVGDGTIWTNQVVDAHCRDEQLVFGADIDGDRDMDVVGATHLDGGIYWWENTDRTGTEWQKHVVDSNMEEDYCRTHCLRVADMDGDESPDIVASAGTESGVNWWKNPKGSGKAWRRHYVAGSDGEVESVYPADLDGDGDTDLVGSIRRHDGLTWWENTNGAATEWTKHVIDSSYTAEQVVDAADMDNDGDLDIVASSRRINAINWWENRDGKATEWAKHVMNKDFDEAWSAYAGDMDGDGNLDVLGVARNATEIAWFENQPARD